jgi:hypothetical protein
VGFGVQPCELHSLSELEVALGPFGMAKTLESSPARMIVLFIIDKNRRTVVEKVTEDNEGGNQS